MKNILLLTASLLIIATTATAASKNRYSPDCEKKISHEVAVAYANGDETFGVIGYKIIYTGLLTDLVIVRTTNEDEPSDILISVRGNKTIDEKECRVQIKEILANGSVSEIDRELQKLY